MIRLTGGEWNGRKIKTPKGMATRPSASRVREGLFDVLGVDVVDSDFYDLFAGSGAVGFEALSRGARHCTFLEAGRGAALCLRENVTLLDCKGRATVLSNPLPNWLKSPGFHPQIPAIIFLDPPYDTDLAEKTLETVAEHEIDWGESILAAQTNRKRNLDLLYGPWRLRKHYPHGDSALWIYEPNNPVN